MHNSEAAAKPKKTPVMQSAMFFSDLLNGKLPPHIEPLSAKFHILKDQAGNAQILEEAPGGEVSFVGKAKVLSTLAQYTRNNEIIARESMGFAASDWEFFVKYWIMETNSLPAKIHNVLPSSATGLSWRRLEFDPEPGPHPLWDELMSRVTNAVALQQWIGSLFHDEADRQTYVWLYGEGGDGKGALLRLLKRVFGITAAAEHVQKGGANQFWTHGLLGKRLIIFGDCNNYAFPMSGLFKSITGNDSVRVEVKGGSVYTTELNCLCIFASNEKPQVEKEADLRRAIFCSFTPPPNKDNHGYETDLWAEAPHILATCMQQYVTMDCLGNRITPSRLDLEEIADVASSEFESIFYRRFELAAYGASTSMATHEIYRILKEEGVKSHHDIAKFYDWLKKTYGLKKIDRRDSLGKKSVTIPGIRAKLWQNLSAPSI